MSPCPQRIHRASRILVLASALLPAVATAQANWTKALPDGRLGTALAYDAARTQVVMFGGFDQTTEPNAETWTRDGGAWGFRRPANAPTGRTEHALAYDAARARVVLFGGRRQTVSNDTWEWNGADWTQSAPAASPPARSQHALAFDSARGRTVLFGGEDAGATRLADTWEWDGTNWTQKSPVNVPPARRDHMLAFDAARARVVLFGGLGTAAAPLGDTWEWDGTNWTQRTPTTSPPARSNATIAYDATRARLVLFGGLTTSNLLGDTWEWDGTNWTQRTPVASPPPRYEAAMAFHAGRARTVLFGGWEANNKSTDTWEYDGTTWLQVLPTGPDVRSAAGLAYDPLRARTVLFGGRVGTAATTTGNDTWEWDGAVWVERTPANRPQARALAALAYDPFRRVMTLFGGLDAGFVNRLGDTWEWNGADWTRRTPTTSPPARSGHAFAFDQARRRLVLFGGNTNTGNAADTWEWDGTDWTLRATAHAPAARSGHGLTYDVVRARVLLFGGFSTLDTWEYDGVDWVQRTPATTPGVSGPLVWDAARARVVLHGAGETWEWNGADWLKRAPALAPYARDNIALAYDLGRGRVVLFGGRISPDNLGDTWEDATTAPADHRAFGAGCAGSAGTPVLLPANDQRPWLGDDFTVEVHGLSPLAQIVIVYFGFSNTQVHGVPLPLNLSSIGMTGCVLYTSLEIPLSATNLGGTARAVFPLPLLPLLAGARIYDQALVFNPGANPVGVVLSNAGAGIFGLR